MIFDWSTHYAKTNLNHYVFASDLALVFLAKAPVPAKDYTARAKDFSIVAHDENFSLTGKAVDFDFVVIV